MFIPAAFAEDDLVWLDRLLDRDAFITLIGTGDDNLPHATQLPVLYCRRGSDILIEGHWAAANPQSRHTGPVLMIAHGPHGYVSPGWYPDKLAASRVPTWNYATAQLRGELELIHDPAVLADLVARTSAHFESRIGKDWAFDSTDPRQQRMLAGIVGFRFRPTQVQVKLKLSQNHPAANRSSVMEQLLRSDDSIARDLGQWMQWRAAPGNTTAADTPDDAASPTAPCRTPPSRTPA